MPETDNQGAPARCDTANVSTTRGVKGGYVFCAPVGTALPNDIYTPLNPAFECVGFVGEDGFTEAVDGGSESIVDMNGDTVDSYDEAKTETCVMKLIEMALQSLKVQYGEKNVEERDGMIVVKHDWSNADDELSWVFELLLKNGRRWRKVVPKGKSGERGEFQGSSTNVAGREVTVTYAKDDDGGGCYDYIEVSPGSAKPKAPEEGAQETPSKSIDDMTVEELKAYAAERSIDLGAASLKADILAAIKAAEQEGE